MHHSLALRTAFFALLLFCLCTCVRAQEAVVSGKVTDTEGEPLIGATVQVIGAVIGTTTDFAGHYELEVPPGRIRFVYSYLGFENYDTTLVVGVAEREFGVDIVLSEDFLQTGEVIVYGRRAAGQAAALRNQQSSQITQTIIHSETFNKYPDVTIAETVSRMPGVSILRDVNDNEIVQLRGLAEQYTAVNLNGQRLPTIQPEVDQTGSLNIIQSNLVDQVRIVKARSANMDGDAIAGIVDFRVRQPEERFEVLAQAGAGANFGFDENPGQSSGITQFAGILNSEIADEKVYFLAAGSYLKQGRGTRTREYEYGSLGQRGRNLYSSRPMDTQFETQRLGLVGAVELRPSIYNKMRLSYNFSEVTQDVQQRRIVANIGEEASVRRFTDRFGKVRALNQVALEVENNFPKTRLDYQLSFSDSEETVANRLRNFFGAEGIAADFNAPDALSSLNNADRVADGDLTSIGRAREGAALNETVAIGSLNITRYLNSKRTSFLKIGTRYRSKDRDYATNVLELEGDGGSISPGTSPVLLTDLDIPNGATDTLLPAYDAKQRIAAAYAMYAANFNAKLSLTAGLRYEYTEVEARNAVDTNRFDNNVVLPSLNLTYRLDRERQFRLSAYQAVARPSYATYRPQQAAPLPLITTDQFSLANPDAILTRSTNFDFTFERYGDWDGLFSASIYAKFLDNPTVLVQNSRQTPNRPVFDNQLVNAGDADVFGFELGFYQSLAFIDNRLRFININGTYNANVFNFNPALNVRGDNLPLPQSPRQSANLSFVYSNPNTRLNLVAAANFRDRVFDRILDGEAVYRNRLLTIDLSADYEIYKNISLYARFNNLTDHEFEEWIGPSDEADSLKRQSAFYGRWGVVGVRFQPR